MKCVPPEAARELVDVHGDVVHIRVELGERREREAPATGRRAEAHVAQHGVHQRHVGAAALQHGVHLGAH